MYHLLEDKVIIKATESKQEVQQILEKIVKKAIKKKKDIWKLSEGYKINGVIYKFYEVTNEGTVLNAD